jgi:hypothetical protein
MADLTPQDRESYGKLRNAVRALNEKIEKIPAATADLLKQLIAALLTQLPENLETLAELEEQLAKVDGYLLMQNLLLETLKLSGDRAIAQASQNVSNQSKQIKASLQDIEDADLSKLDDLNPPCADALFLGFITGEAKTWTEKLLDGYPPNLSSIQIKQLTDAWGTAVRAFVEDARKKKEPQGQVKPGKPDTIMHFFCIHEELEALYDNLSKLVA